MIKLKTLVKKIPQLTIKGSKEVELTGISSNSKCTAPGHLFIAKQGRSDQGSRYIPEALDAGAVAIVTDIYNPLLLKKVTQLIHPNPGAIEGELAAQFYHQPDGELFVVGVTGTNGKTTCSFLVKHLLDRIGDSCGLIGTIEYLTGGQRYPATHTTPDPITNQRLLREMVSNQCRAVAMEVSSHALDQGRVDSIEFDVGIFTNLSLDHLDYHKNMESYAAAKGKLFSHLSLRQKPGISCQKRAIINVDSPWGKQMAMSSVVPVLTYGFKEVADITASNLSFSYEGTQFDLTYQGKTVKFRWRIAGRFNISNCLAAVGVGIAKGVPLEKIAEILQDFHAAPGRLEKVSNPAGLNIYVDYAHTDDALRNVLECLREMKMGKIITVFGCGGNRDTSKRPKMAQVVEELSDLAIITSDNPRDEDPQMICAEILQGFSRPSSYLVELDRRKAIEIAIKTATQKDIILIAGKGHETYQIFRHQTVEFDDRKVAIELCSK